MIRSFRDKRTERFSSGGSVREFRSFAKSAERRLALLDAAQSLSELAALPGNRLEALRGSRQGQYSIRINDRWRLCFVWNEEHRAAEQVEIVDYH